MVFQFTLASSAISFPEAAILLVSDGDRDLWPGPTPEVRDSRTSRHPAMLRGKSDKSDWFWSRSIVFTKPFKTRMSLDLARGPDFSSACQKGPLGTRLHPGLLCDKMSLEHAPYVAPYGKFSGCAAIFIVR